MPKSAECQTARNAEERGMPKCAERQTARNAKRRGTPKSAERQRSVRSAGARFQNGETRTARNRRFGSRGKRLGTAAGRSILHHGCVCGPLVLFAVRRSSAFSAVRRSALFGVQRCSAFSAVRRSALFGVQ